MVEGIYAAAITPMTDSGELNIDSLKEYVRWQKTRGLEGLYVCGSSGEGLLLSLEERKRLLETIIREVDGDFPVIAHVGTIRTADVIDLAQHAAAAGAAAVSMIPPYYYSFSLKEIIGYYQDVMKATDIPTIIYNIPAFTGVSFNVSNSRELFEDPQLLGIKHTSMNLYDLERMKNSYPDKVYFNGYDEIFLSGLAAGCNAAVGTTVNLFNREFKQIRKLYLEGEMQQAAAIQTKINDAIETFVSVGIFNAVKYAFTLMGIDCGSCRKPFIALTEEGKAQVEMTMKSMDLLDQHS